MYAVICRHDGIKARDIAREIGVTREEINHLLYSKPFIHDLCYQDSEFRWHGLIRQKRPHTGLGDFCGYYGSVQRFLNEPEEEWFSELLDGCRQIGRNLNDTRGLFHSFRDTREVMIGLMQDLDGVDVSSWEIAFELRIKRSRYIRIYADVLVITEDRVFSLEFKMKKTVDPEEVEQAAKYVPYLEIVFGPGYEIIPVLVLTGIRELFDFVSIGKADRLLPVCSGDMLFNVFDEYLGFLQ